MLERVKTSCNLVELFMIPEVVKLGIAVFLLFNVYINIYAILTYEQILASPVIVIVFLFFFSIFKEDLFQYLFIVFGFLLFLFGFHSYDIQSHFFEMILSLFCLVLLARQDSGTFIHDVRTHYLSLFLMLYIVIAMFSLLLLPVQEVLTKAYLWGIRDFFYFLINSTPASPGYSIVAVNRLFLFSLVAVLLSCSGSFAEKYFSCLFKGAVWGLIAAAILGILEYFNILSLAWYVPEVQNRLHSTFLNRGWYSEYVICLTPLLFLGLCRFPRRKTSFFLTFTAVLIVGVSILFCGARTGWGLFAAILAGSSFIFVGQGNRWQNILKGFLFFLVVALIIIVLSFSFLKSPQRLDEPGVRSLKSMSTKQVFLQKRLDNFFQTGRIKNWEDTLHIIGSRYMFGRGYESFNRQGHVLDSIPSSNYKKNQQHRKIRDTAHNFYLQLIVSNGFVGLIIWLFLSGYASLVLFKDYKCNGSCESMVILICLIAFHLYGLTQSMQYVPMIWFLVFLFIGYAMMREKVIGKQKQQKKIRFAVGFSVICCLFAVSSYAFNVALRQEALRYSLEVFAVDQDLNHYRGFYPKEDWGKQGVFRWTGRRAVIKLDKLGVVGFDFSCSAPGLSVNPIVLDVLFDGRPLDRVTFWNNRTISRNYYIPMESQRGGRRIELQVSRTWNPRREGISADYRNLGVAVSEPKYQGRMPADDIGFYGWQMEVGAGDEQKEKNELRYRWTGQEAVLAWRGKKKTPGSLLLKTEQPFLNTHPVDVLLFQQDKQIGSLRLADYKWNRIQFPQHVQTDVPLVIRVNRTWNPKREGYSDDPRDLGVALTVLTAEETAPPMRKQDDDRN